VRDEFPHRRVGRPSFHIRICRTDLQPRTCALKRLSREVLRCCRISKVRGHLHARFLGFWRSSIGQRTSCKLAIQPRDSEQFSYGTRRWSSINGRGDCSDDGPTPASVPRWMKEGRRARRCLRLAESWFAEEVGNLLLRGFFARIQVDHPIDQNIATRKTSRISILCREI
jgi:hypothetical protein